MTLADLEKFDTCAGLGYFNDIVFREFSSGKTFLAVHLLPPAIVH